MTGDAHQDIPGVYRVNRTHEDGSDLDFICSTDPHWSFGSGELLYVSGKKTTLKAAMKRYTQFRETRRKPEEEYWILMPLDSYPKVKLSQVFPLGFIRLSRGEIEDALESENCIRHPEMLKIVKEFLAE